LPSTHGVDRRCRRRRRSEDAVPTFATKSRFN
jgi:hypothetical protein